MYEDMHREVDGESDDDKIIDQLAKQEDPLDALLDDVLWYNL